MKQHYFKTIEEVFKFQSLRRGDWTDSRLALEERIYSCLTPAYFRLGSISKDTEAVLRAKIALSISENKPVFLAYATGWGKNYKSYSAPHINWAELLHYWYLYYILGSLCEIYPPGVVIDHSPDDYAVMLINGYRKGWLDIYKSELLELYKYINSVTPENFEITFTPSSKWYNYKKLRDEVEVVQKSLLRKPEECERLYKDFWGKANNNLVLEDGVSEKQKKKLLEKSIRVHHAWIEVDYKYRREYLEGGINIPIAHRKGIPGTYCLKNYFNSSIQFWKGDGLFVDKGGRYSADIISPKRWGESQSDIKFVQVSNPTGVSVFDSAPIL